MPRSVAEILITSIVNAPIADVFAFHLDTRNAARIAPRGQRIVAIEGAFPASEGDEIRLAVRQFPIPSTQRWRVVVERVVAPTLVVDRMLSGPFAAWRHEHRFEEVAPGRTRLIDAIAYRLPLGPLGALADMIVVRRLLERAFRERHVLTRDLLERGQDRVATSASP